MSNVDIKIIKDITFKPPRHCLIIEQGDKKIDIDITDSVKEAEELISKMSFHIKTYKICMDVL